MGNHKKKKTERIIYTTPKPNNYYVWNPFKKIGFNLYAGIKDKITNMRFPTYHVIALSVIIVLLLGLIGFIRLNMIVVEPRGGFDLTNFTHATDTQGEIHTIENDRFEFFFDETTTQFSLFDTQTNQTWNSNVTEDDPFPGVTSNSLNAQQNTLVVRYVDASGVERSIQNYTESIQRDQFYIHYPDDKTVEVFYEIGDTDIDYTDLPQRLSRERFETMILDYIDEDEEPLEYRFLTNAYNYVSEQEVYALNNAASFSQNAIERLYNIIFNMTPYTVEDFEDDHIEQGVELPDTKPMIKVGIRYTLTNEGFDATIINESIEYSRDYPLANIDLLPNFAEASTSNEGYMFVPEGSGALINLNNGKSTREYNQRLYGLDDAKVPMREPNTTESTALPLFGMKKDDGAFLGIITQGDAMSSLHARVSEQRDSYNRVYPRFHYMESDRIRIPGVTSTEQSQLFRRVWTRFYSEQDYSVSYRFTDEQNADYLGMASLYREYLIDLGLSPQSRAGELSLNLTLLGGYQKQNHFVGIPYQTIEPLTTTDQAEIILDALIDNDVHNINLIYQGWMNDGIEHYLPNDINFHRSIGALSDFEGLLQYTNDRNINLYPEVNFVRPYTNKNLNESSDTARTIAGELAIHYKYNLATQLPDTQSRAQYILNPTMIESLMEDFNEAYRDLPFENIAVNDLANRLSGSYNNQEHFFRYETLALQEEALASLVEDNQEVLLRNPLGYAIPFGDLILDLPVRGTEFNIIDRSIPFYQLALSGMMDYSGPSFNLFDERSIEWHKLKALETGSHLNFTWTYLDTYDLMHTEYNYLYSTQYENWLDISTDMYQEIYDLAIHNARLIYHTEHDRDIVEVGYDNDVSIIINYRNTPYDHEGVVIDSMDYRYVKGGEE